MADDNIERIQTKDVRQEEGAHELATSPDMKPYLEFIKAVIQEHDPSPELESNRPVAAGKALHLESGVGATVSIYMLESPRMKVRPECPTLPR